eukprot:CAMPEP_0174338648 /NCGR_PEP_ID=MMETSP0810-20121108/23307_1 /TAXON_ID=73025 ORGANISM="Eutreptiella gymnastica-like, Strain CCMP1594" /NCGR_SAMPLE_ID=MMETSP0810 /ASSEMBLY_ACC=CAM_ASM_000659 /LENGTH=43 /DNA_ID= /DNA_START= /DNA_END= /DNA_ORIENTATION=
MDKPPSGGVGQEQGVGQGVGQQIQPTHLPTCAQMQYRRELDVR